MPPHRRKSASVTDAAPAALPLRGSSSGDRSSYPRPRIIRGSFSTGDCGCARSGNIKSIYSDKHSVCRQALGSNARIIGTGDQFCASFFHIEPTPEGGIEEVCLSAACGGTTCPRKTVVGVARLHALDHDGNATEELYVARYSNCWKGSSEANVHAEVFLLSDASLSRALESLPESGGRLTFYLTYQPCHHSGGHSKGNLGKHTTSCTELLCDHVRDVLTPRRVHLDLRIAYIYRAHWETGAYDPKYAPAVQAARDGLALLALHGVGLAALGPADWQWLVDQCDEYVRVAWREMKHPLGAAVREQRTKMDRFIADFLSTVCEAPQADGRGELDAPDSAGFEGARPENATHAVGADTTCQPCRG